METNRLKQFCAIVELGSFTRASALMNISHSGLSKSMRLLEQELRTPLFRPAGRGIIVTDHGRQIYSQAKRILDETEALLRPAPDKGEIKIGSLEVFLSPVGVNAAASLFLGKKVTLIEMNPGQMEAAVLDATIDLGLTYSPHPLEGVEFLKIKSFDFGCYVKRGSFKGAQATDIPFVVPHSTLGQNPLGIKERDSWPESLAPRKKLFFVNLLSTALQLVEEGLCAVFIPHFLADRHNKQVHPSRVLESVALPSKIPTKQFAYLVKREGSLEDKSTKALAKIIRTAI